jgi:hypothetical protein
MPRAARLSLFTLLAVLALISMANVGLFSLPAYLQGEVRDASGPVAGARVRFKGLADWVLSDSQGHFHLPVRPNEARRITAWKDGYLIAGARADRRPLLLELAPLLEEDCESYSWVDPSPNRSRAGNCANCHAEIYREWEASGHAHSITNRHFLSLYEGTDWHGNPVDGWSLRAEHPNGVGVCTACHAPTVPFTDPAYFNLAQVQDVARQGVHCDYCHKITGATGGTLGITHGRFGLQLLRPAQGQLFFGPLDDVDRSEDAYSSLYQDSRYCAPCHEGVVFGVHVYSTYSEWLDSPAGKEGKQCQSCHMAPTGRMTNIAPGRGGIARDPKTLGNHRFFAGSQLDMLRQALSLSASMDVDGQQTTVTVDLRADGAGHRVPTGSADRHLVLIVDALDQKRKVLPTHTGSTLPALVGNEFAGRPGRLFAKVLRDFDGNSPAPFWRADANVDDLRLAPGQPEKETITYQGEAQCVRVRLLYRRIWPEVAQSKHWPDNEMTIIDRTMER